MGFSRAVRSGVNWIVALPERIQLHEYEYGILTIYARKEKLNDRQLVRKAFEALVEALELEGKADLYLEEAREEDI